ncbi:MAG TPA: BON domain-containing protein [Gammaproteobacteria bacterium]|jgi:osmotically-inducible protein OsmY|nr:BON domain-containing protein [Acidiferrobacteraceae bacterium]HCV20483.1 BON domain-containing protein [Gammaproteobacteria bacterium]|tara:strand:- start:4253 stop:4858 length:606 start_codon:yes stop_codon:yes gene_type:complete
MMKSPLLPSLSKNRLSLLALLLTATFLISGCGIILVTTAAVSAIDVIRDRREIGTLWDDNKMELSLRQSISKNEQIDNANVSVTAFNGIALLTGEVPDQRAIDQILDLAKSHPDASQVINRIELAGKTNLNSRANDSWITGRVKSAMLTSGTIDTTKIKVVTERANVYLMGLVSRSEAEAAVVVTRSVPGVVRVIKVFEYL